VAEKIEIYPVLKTEFASIGDPIVERDSGRSFLVEASKGLWRTDINFSLIDGRDTTEKHNFSSGDEQRAIKSLRKHAEEVLIDNGFEVCEASEEQSKVDITYRKGSVTGSIAFAASSGGNKMTLSYSHEER
jgi:hypothetical protein